MQRVLEPSEFRRTERLAILEGRNAAVRMCEALKAHMPAIFGGALYIAEAPDEGSIAYAVKLHNAFTLGDAGTKQLRCYAQAWLDCLEANAVYEHLASVEVLYESPFLRQAIANIFRPEQGAEALARLELAYVKAKLAAGVEVRLHDGVRARSMEQYEFARFVTGAPREEGGESGGATSQYIFFSPVCGPSHGRPPLAHAYTAGLPRESIPAHLPYEPGSERREGLRRLGNWVAAPPPDEDIIKIMFPESGFRDVLAAHVPANEMGVIIDALEGKLALANDDCQVVGEEEAEAGGGG